MSRHGFASVSRVFHVGTVQAMLPCMNDMTPTRTENEMINKYTVTNTHDIAGTSIHRTPEAALRAAAKREGDGWIVVDDGGCRWDYYGAEAVIVG
jgi:hypothetical protein